MRRVSGRDTAGAGVVVLVLLLGLGSMGLGWLMWPSAAGPLLLPTRPAHIFTWLVNHAVALGVNPPAHEQCDTKCQCAEYADR